MDRRRKARVVRSCTECKQVKLRCDAQQTLPGPCTRCSTRGLECVVDAEFRRTPARQRLDALCKEVKTLRQTLSQVAPQSNPDALPHLQPRVVAEPAGSSSLQTLDHIILGDVESSQLGDCVFSQDELNLIFSTFLSHFYEHLPIIDLPLAPVSLQVSSPFLYWTIVVIVAQRAPSAFPGRSADLIEAYTPLLEKAILATPLTLPTIQALLYLSTWPLPVDYQPRDQSWTIMGAIVNAALYSALHKPSHPQSLRSVGVFIDGRSRSALWLAIFHVSTRLSLSIGVPPLLTSLEHFTAISEMATDATIPRPLAAIAEIQVCTAKYMSLLSDSPEFHLATLLERNFKHETDLIRNRYASAWNSDIELAYLDSKLHVITVLAVRQDTQLNSLNENAVGLPIDASLLASLSNGFSHAIRMIQMVCNDQRDNVIRMMVDQHAVSRSELYLQGRPKLHFKSLMFATFYLLRYHVPQDAICRIEGNLVHEYIKMACDYLRNNSVRPKDEAGRALSVIETLRTFSAALPGVRMGPIRIKERLGASIFYDALTRANELRARPTQLSSDRDNPQQPVLLGTPIKETDETNTFNNEAGISAENFPAEGGYLANLPEDWMDHLDLDIMELSGDLFTGAAMFS